MRIVETDYLVIGSGMAGLSAARELAPHGKVLVVTKREKWESNTNYAQGGIACVTLEDDTFEMHVADTLVAGAGLCPCAGRGCDAPVGMTSVKLKSGRSARRL